MTGPPAVVTGSQLIYTNVEADLSPTRQRGFQVWLCSSDLTADQRRATAKRLDDFRLPPVADPQDVARHVYFRLPDSLYVIARTVPSTERDKFGRGGKFHAHAVLLSEEAFRTLEYDPFRVIDSGFPFHTCPADAMSDGKLRSGDLPRAEIRPGPPTLEATGAQNLLAPLVHHFDQSADKPVVVADRPDKVLALLRGWFSRLPPCVRKKVAFDTLSTGGSLTETRYAAVGAFSAESLKMWSFRGYHRFDPATGGCSPPLPGAPAAVVGEVLRVLGWADLTGPERDVVFETSKALAEQRLEDLCPDDLSSGAAAVLDGCGSLAPLRARAVDERVRRDLPSALAGLPKVRAAIENYFAGFLSGVLPQLREPIPHKLLAKELYEYLIGTDVRPTGEVLAALANWLKSGPSVPRLKWILGRWRGTDQSLSRIEELLAAPDSADRVGWFRNWIIRTLPGASSAYYLERMPAGRPAPTRILADARLWLAVQGDSADHREPELRLVTALHRGPAVLSETLSQLRKSSVVMTRFVQMVADQLRDRSTVGWGDVELGNTYLGLFLVPDQTVDHTVLEVLSEERYNRLARPLQNELRPVGNSPSRAGGETASDLPGPIDRLYRKILEAAPKERTEIVAELRALLTKADDDTYRLCANKLIEKVRGEAVTRRLIGGAYLTGLKLAWMDQSKVGNHHGLFEAIVGAVADEVRIGTVPQIGRPIDPTADRRFTWLMARLADPVGTEQLPI